MQATLLQGLSVIAVRAARTYESCCDNGNKPCLHDQARDLALEHMEWWAEQQRGLDVGDGETRMESEIEAAEEIGTRRGA